MLHKSAQHASLELHSTCKCGVIQYYASLLRANNELVMAVQKNIYPCWSADFFFFFFDNLMVHLVTCYSCLNLFYFLTVYHLTLTILCGMSGILSSKFLQASPQLQVYSHSAFVHTQLFSLHSVSLKEAILVTTGGLVLGRSQFEMAQSWCTSDMQTEIASCCCEQESLCAKLG